MMIGMTLLLALGVAIRNWFGVIELYVGTLILSFAIGMLNALTAPLLSNTPLITLHLLQVCLV